MSIHVFVMHILYSYKNHNKTFIRGISGIYEVCFCYKWSRKSKSPQGDATILNGPSMKLCCNILSSTFMKLYALT